MSLTMVTGALAHDLNLLLDQDRSEVDQLGGAPDGLSPGMPQTTPVLAPGTS